MFAWIEHYALIYSRICIFPFFFSSSSSVWKRNQPSQPCHTPTPPLPPLSIIGFRIRLLENLIEEPSDMMIERKIKETDVILDASAADRKGL